MERMKSYSGISLAECENILDIIQRDFGLRHRERKHLSKLQEEVNELNTQRKFLSKGKEFNDKCCIQCRSTFNLLFRRKLQCHDCHYWICRSCISWENKSKFWICEVCSKQRVLDTESWAWFYNRLKSYFGHFGSAKVLESICRKRRISDSENDSGYGPCSDLKPIFRLFPPYMLQSFSSMADSSSHEDCDDEDEDIGEEEEEEEIHHSIETIVEGLLGSTLDDASVDHVYSNFPEYEKIFLEFHSQLVTAVKNLSLSLQRALHNVPHDNDVTPTAAHGALKRLISALVSECQDLPYLQPPEIDINIPSDDVTLIDLDIFSSYEGLVASAIINKVVEDNQAKYLQCANNIPQIVDLSENKEIKCPNDGKFIHSKNSEFEPNSFTETELPLECVQIEEIEEITHEYTDSDDDKFSSISHHSRGVQSIDDVTVQRCGSEIDLLGDVDPRNNGKIPFPEFGSDLIEDLSGLDNAVTCYPVVVASWEENWLFRKKNRSRLCNSLKCQLLSYLEEPPYMLIPCPSENIDVIETDELSSELSESHSVGSLEFSSSSEDQKLEENTEYKVVEVSAKAKQDVKRDVQLLNTEVPMPRLDECAIQKDLENRTSSSVSCQGGEDERINVYELNRVFETKISSIDIGNTISMQRTSTLPPQNTVEKNVSTCSRSAVVGHSTANEVSSVVTSQHTGKDNEFCLTESMQAEKVAGDIFFIPTQPGTIAEREHKKWLNAVPLKNNPYSAENISRRYSNPHTKVLLGHVSSFEEFEQKFNDYGQCTIKEPLQTRLYCGLKSIDRNLYKRDYYVNGSQLSTCERDKHFKSLPSFESFNSESYESIPEEALNSLEEKVYVSAGKVFTLENHVKRLERELKDMNMSSDGAAFRYCSEKMLTSGTSNVENDPHHSSDNDDNLILPSVKTLANKFSFPSLQTEQKMVPEKPSCKTEEDGKIKKSRPCMKVHSLTARSLSREFRDRAKQNIPKPMNRLHSVPLQVSDDTTSEHESICSPASASSPVCAPHNDAMHGYTSDDSSTSTSSLPRPKARRHISRSILQRASYWEKRVEQGLLSDASVSEEFPGLPVTADEI